MLTHYFSLVPMNFRLRNKLKRVKSCEFPVASSGSSLNIDCWLLSVFPLIIFLICDTPSIHRSRILWTAWSLNLRCINFRRAIHLRFSAIGIHQEIKFYETSVYKFSIFDLIPSLNHQFVDTLFPLSAYEFTSINKPFRSRPMTKDRRPAVIYLKPLLSKPQASTYLSPDGYRDWASRHD
jgi:hypothetical protein